MQLWDEGYQTLLWPYKVVFHAPFASYDTFLVWNWLLWKTDRLTGKPGQRNFLINLATVCSPRGLSQKLRLRSVKTAVAWSLFFVLKMQGYMGRGSPLLCHKLIKLATFSADNKNCRWRDYAMSQIWNYGRFAICHWCKILPETPSLLIFWVCESGI